MEPPSSILTDTSFPADPASEDPLAANLYNNACFTSGLVSMTGFVVY